MSPDADTINEIAAELGVEAAFIEKDWYSCKVLKALSEVENDTITIIFSGGTSLSKAHNIIQRFSEDLDFRCRYKNEMSGNQKKKSRSEFREQVVAKIRDLGFFNLADEQISVASNYIKFSLQYTSLFNQHDALRPHLEVEFSFTQPQLEPKLEKIFSFVAQFTANEAEASIQCLAPVEIAADKLSALYWRVITRDREQESDDPALVRHLHDLCALGKIVDANLNTFVDLLKASFDTDQASANRNTGNSLPGSIETMLDLIVSDENYRLEYQRFVDAMSYADDDATLGFDAAVTTLNDLYFDKVKGRLF